MGGGRGCGGGKYSEEAFQTLRVFVFTVTDRFAGSLLLCPHILGSLYHTLPLGATLILALPGNSFIIFVYN